MTWPGVWLVALGFMGAGHLAWSQQCQGTTRNVQVNIGTCPSSPVASYVCDVVFPDHEERGVGVTASGVCGNIQRCENGTPVPDGYFLCFGLAFIEPGDGQYDEVISNTTCGEPLVSSCGSGYVTREYSFNRSPETRNTRASPCCPAPGTVSLSSPSTTTCDCVTASCQAVGAASGRCVPNK